MALPVDLYEVAEKTGRKVISPVSDFEIGKDEFDFKVSIIGMPFLLTKERYKALRFNTRKEMKLRRGLPERNC